MIVLYVIPVAVVIIKCNYYHYYTGVLNAIRIYSMAAAIPYTQEMNGTMLDTFFF